MTGTVDEVKNSSDTRVQDMLNRRPVEKEVDTEQYLQWLTERRQRWKQTR
jgi:hypothetical protein